MTSEKIASNEKPSGRVLDRVRGCLFGGAVGDALGYPVEFLSEGAIRRTYGEKGITEYQLDSRGLARISDDTQMTLFTACGVVSAETRARRTGEPVSLRAHVARAYEDWLVTQNGPYELSRLNRSHGASWLLEVPELYSRRAPGITCLSALGQEDWLSHDTGHPCNDSKGCGGIMRVAPIALGREIHSPEEAAREAAEAAAITHGHSLGYMPAAVLAAMIWEIVYGEEGRSLRDIAREAEALVSRLFPQDPHLPELTDLMDLALDLADSGLPAREAISQLGEGWVGEEALAIAVYCSLRFENSFSDAVMAAVNHRGDSDSTGAVTGNILGARKGYAALEDRWKQNLELAHVILELADDLAHGCPEHEDGDWDRKYLEGHWQAEPGTRKGEEAPWKI